MSAIDSLSERKSIVRRLALGRRDRLTLEQRIRRSATICLRLTGLPELRSAEVVLAFASFRSEVLTAHFIEWCLQQGKRVALPRIEGPRLIRAYQINDMEFHLEPRTYGISEPVPGLPEVRPEDIDAILMPGSAFDRSGGRLGYGGGYYDTFLQQAPQAVRIAACFAAQIVDDVPMDEHDLRVDCLVTEQGVLRFCGPSPS